MVFPFMALGLVGLVGSVKSENYISMIGLKECRLEDSLEQEMKTLQERKMGELLVVLQELKL